MVSHRSSRDEIILVKLERGDFIYSTEKNIMGNNFFWSGWFNILKASKPKKPLTLREHVSFLKQL